MEDLVKKIIDLALENGLNSIDLDKYSLDEDAKITLENIANLNLDAPTRVSLFEEILSYINNHKEDYNNCGIAKVYVDVVYRLSLIYVKRHMMDEYYDLLVNAIDYASIYSTNQFECFEQSARVYFRISQGINIINNHDEKLGYLIKAKELIDKCFVSENDNPPYELLSTIYIALIDVTCDYEEIKNIFSKVIKIYEEHDIVSSIGDLHLAYGKRLLKFQETDILQEGIKALYDALEIFEEEESDVAILNKVTIHQLLATYYFQNKEKDLSISHIEKAISEVFKIKTHGDNVANTLFNAANICFQFGEDEKASDYFKLLIDFSKTTPISFKVIELGYNYYGQLLVKMKQYDESINIYNELDNKVEEIKDNLYEDKYHSLLANIKYRLSVINLVYKNDMDKAYDFIIKAIEEIKQIKQYSDEDVRLIQSINQMMGK